jgi:hypothetical protein
MWKIVGSSFVAAVIVAIGIAALFYDPAAGGDHPFWDAVKDIGPAIAGSWVLAAGILTVTATWMTTRANVQQAVAGDSQRKEAIRQICIGEIKSFWDRANQLELHKNLKDHLIWLREIQTDPTKRPNLFRRSLGDDWFPLSRINTLAIGELQPEIGSRYLSLSARVRNIVSRFNWLNSASYAEHKIGFWTHYHADTLEVLSDLYTPSQDMLRRLGDTQTDPATFRF